MLKDFLKEVIKEAKKEYLEIDHHGYTDGDEKFKQDWNRDLYEEWVDPIIYNKDIRLWECCDKFMLYMVCSEIIKGE